MAIRAVLSAGLLYCIYLVVTQAIALWHFRYHPLPEGALEAIEWDARNPEYYRMLGRYYERSVLDGDAEKAVRFYKWAVERDPNQAQLWAELGGAYRAAGRPGDAREAYEQARELFPNSPSINWRLGNFYIQQGRVEEALAALRKALLGDPQLRLPAYELIWTAGVKRELILARMIPPDVDIYFHYLNYLVRTDRLEAAVQVWERLLDLEQGFEPHATFPYLDALIRGRRIDQLTEVWEAVINRNASLFRRQPWDQNLILNGDFESQILNGGLGWRIRPAEGVVVKVDTLTFFDGTRSLKIQFGGELNLDYRHITHHVSVRPDTNYRFVAYTRARSITTDSGPRLELVDFYNRNEWFFHTGDIVGTSSWTRHELEFTTGRDTKLLTLRVVRAPSQKFDNKIAGTLWVDRVSLTRIE